MKKLTPFTLIALVLFLFSACSKDHSVKKEESATQVAVKFQVFPVDPKGQVGKPQNAIIIGNKDKLKEQLLHANSFKLKKISEKYQAYQIVGSGVVVGTDPVEPCQDINGNPCHTDPHPDTTSCLDDYNAWVQELYPQWQEEANSTCNGKWYHFGCDPVPNGDLPIVYSIYVGPSLKSGCFVIHGNKTMEELFKTLFTPVPLPSGKVKLATAIKKVYAQ